MGITKVQSMYTALAAEGSYVAMFNHFRQLLWPGQLLARSTYRPYLLCLACAKRSHEWRNAPIQTW